MGGGSPKEGLGETRQRVTERGCGPWERGLLSPHIHADPEDPGDEREVSAASEGINLPAERGGGED